MTRERRTSSDLLPGEWACLGLLVERQSHGFALSSELSPTGEIGRIWSLSRPLTYRTLLAATRSGRSAFRTWVTTPVTHLRDLRSELLLKLTLARRCSIPIDDLVRHQRDTVDDIRRGLVSQMRSTPHDLVTMWRLRSAEAAVHFLDDLQTV